MIQLRTFLIILLFGISSIVSATNYYVSSTGGNDALDGKSEATSWKTISKVNGNTFLSGDSILFKAGDIWRETLRIPSSGRSGSYITFGSYGSGANPIICGSQVSTGWTNYSGNIWVSNSTFTNPRAGFLCDIFFVEPDNSVSWGLFKASTGSLLAEYNWTWSGNYIYVYSTSDPGSRYTSVEIPQRQACLNLNNKEYIEINGIDFFYGIYEGITYDWNYPQLDLKELKIENCEIAYIGGNITNFGNENGFGIDVAYSNMIVRNCEIHHCGRRGLAFHLYGSGFTVRNVLVEQNYFHDGYHTTGVDISVGSGSYSATFDGVIVRRNLFYDSPTSHAVSNQIFIQNQKYASGLPLNNIYIYSNIFKYPNNAAIMSEACQSVYIYNNTFYNHNTTKNGNVMHVWIDANNSSVKVKNNIFYTELSIDNNGNGLELYSLTDYKKVDADYNLYYRTSSSLKIINFNKTGYSSSQIATVRSNYGWETHCPTPANPFFVSSSDFHLQSSSPANGAGIAIPEITTDYEGNPYTNPPNIGCYATPGIPINLAYVNSVVEKATPSLLEMTYNKTLANIVPATSAFTVTVNSAAITINTVAISGTKVLLTLVNPVIKGDVVTVSYTKPTLNPLQTGSGEQASGISDQPVVNNCNNVNPAVIITSPINGSSLTAPASLTITALASDVDGTISKVEFYNEANKLGEITTAPYSYTWNNVDKGTYVLLAIATDNQNATTTSSSVKVYVIPGKQPNEDLISLFPSPNDGNFNIQIINPLQNEKGMISILTSTGKKVYECLLMKEETSKHFELSFLDPGLYILMIYENEILAIKKFIKI